jgi:hypothetical protein
MMPFEVNNPAAELLGIQGWFFINVSVCIKNAA